MTRWPLPLLIACLSLGPACGDDDTPPAEDDSGTTTNPTATSPTATNPTTTMPGTDTGTTGGTTTDGTTGGTTGDTTNGEESSSSGGSSSDGESSSSGGGSSSSGMADPCDAGDGPIFMVTNNGFSDYVIDGVNDPNLTLVRGCTYTFNINAPGHPFYVKTAPVIGVGSTYDVGVTNNGTSTGVLVWDVPMAAPDALFYNCEFHAPMTGAFTIIN